MQYGYALSENKLVTTTTDPLGHMSRVYTNGSGQTTKTIQYGDISNTQEIVTTFGYDGIQRLVEVTDADTNRTVTSYDMLDRVLSVNHPASGLTSYSYDVLGNVVWKITAMGDTIRYTYSKGRLTGISYPRHSENDVTFVYGDDNDMHHAKGRVKLRIDGSGAIEYEYDNMGNVVKTRRTLIVPNHNVATFDMAWTYDSHGRLLDMTYPDNETVVYWYNPTGDLQSVYRGKRTGPYYIEDIGYDKFGQRVYMEYPNGMKTRYTYDNNLRLNTLSVGMSANSKIIDNTYSYDAVSNITSISGISGISNNYGYDPLSRLINATGHFGTGADTASYSFSMAYDNMYRIISKSQQLAQNNVILSGQQLFVGHTLNYAYRGHDTGSPFQLSTINEDDYRTTDQSKIATSTLQHRHDFGYDANGNVVYDATARKHKNNVFEDKTSEVKYRWDEENRLLGISENGYVSTYWYDADGNRTVKEHGANTGHYVNSAGVDSLTSTGQFTLYVNPYVVVSNDYKYANHIYVDGMRVVSKVKNLDLSSFNGHRHSGDRR